MINLACKLDKKFKLTDTITNIVNQYGISADHVTLLLNAIQNSSHTQINPEITLCSCNDNRESVLTNEVVIEPSISNNYDDLIERFEINKKTTGIQKLEIILQVHASSLLTTLKLTDAASTFMRQTVKKIFKCYFFHCNQNSDFFIEKHGDKWKTTKFDCVIDKRCFEE